MAITRLRAASVIIADKKKGKTKIKHILNFSVFYD